MGFSQLLNRLTIKLANANPNLPVQKFNDIFPPQTITFAAATASLNLIKNSIFLHRSLICAPNSTGFSPNPHENLPFFPGPMYYTPFRSVHDVTVNTQAVIDPNAKNPNSESVQIMEEADKLCRIISAHRTSSGIESLLNSAHVEFTPALVEEVLKRLSNSGVLAFSFFQWAEKQKGFKYTSESYNVLIEALGKIKQFKMIWNIVNEMKSRRVLTKDTFALISRRYARARKVKEAKETFERMEKFGFKLEVSDYNRLIDTLSKSRHVERAQEVFDKLKNRKFKPDIKSYTILLEGWGQEQNLLRLDEVYREMRDDGFHPDVVTYGIIIHGYCKARKYDTAVELFHEMKRKNIKPTPHIYCTLINGIGSDKRLNEALKFFELYKASNFIPEAPIYNAVVGSYCQSLRMDDAYRVIEEMRKCGIGPNSRTYDIVLHHLVKAQRTKEAYSVFQKMSEEPGCEPTVSIYEIMARMFCNEERMDMAIKIWDQMKAKGILPTMHMFSTLINSFCYENRLDEACKYLQEMLDMGIRPPAQMFSKLKQALLDEGKNTTIQSLAEMLEQTRNTPLVGQVGKKI